MRTPNLTHRRGVLRRLLDLVQPVASAPESGSTTPVITLVPIASRHASERDRSKTVDDAVTDDRRAA